MKALDYETLNPGIRKLVKLLRDEGFTTTDSGDGKTNVAAGMEGAMDVANVAIRVLPRHLVDEADHLASFLYDYIGSVPLNGRNEVSIMASYDPRHPGIGLIMLLGVDDEMLEEGE